MTRSPFLLGQPVCETETDGIMESVCNAVISIKAYFGQAVVRVYRRDPSSRRIRVKLLASYCENKCSVFSCIVPVEGCLPFWERGGGSACLSPQFYVRVKTAFSFTSISSDRKRERGSCPCPHHDVMWEQRSLFLRSSTQLRYMAPHCGGL